jgi:hypothetical protein
MDRACPKSEQACVFNIYIRIFYLLEGRAAFWVRSRGTGGISGYASSGYANEIVLRILGCGLRIVDSSGAKPAGARGQENPIDAVFFSEADFPSLFHLCLYAVGGAG